MRRSITPTRATLNDSKPGAPVFASIRRGPVTGSTGNAVNFDPQRRAASPGLKAAIKSLSVLLEQREEALGLRQRRRSAAPQAGFKLAIEALTCNLAGLLMLGSQRPLAVPRHNGAMWGKGRYRSPAYGQHFLDALFVMAHPEIGLIEDVARGYGFPNGVNQRSTIRPTIRLVEHLPAAATELGWDAFRRDDDPEVLILRDHKHHASGQAASIDYCDTAGTKRLRREVDRINRYLRGAAITLLPDDDTTETDDGQPLDPTRRTVRRIFNNASWDQGVAGFTAPSGRP